MPSGMQHHRYNHQSLPPTNGQQDDPGTAQTGASPAGMQPPLEYDDTPQRTRNTPGRVGGMSIPLGEQFGAHRPVESPDPSIAYTQAQGGVQPAQWAASEPETTHRVSEFHRGERNPRVLAALCYALPLVPAVVMLAIERRNRYVRLHAAQALVYFVFVACVQSLLFIAMVAAGTLLPGGIVEAIVGLTFYAVFLGLGILALIWWLHLLRGAMSGSVAFMPVVSPVAVLLERVQGMITLRRRGSAQNVPHGRT